MSSKVTSRKMQSSLLKKLGRQESSSRMDCDHGLVCDKYATNADGAVSSNGCVKRVVATTSQILHTFVTSDYIASSLVQVGKPVCVWKRTFLQECCRKHCPSGSEPKGRLLSFYLMQFLITREPCSQLDSDGKAIHQLTSI